MILNLQAALLTHPGKKRSNNEDYVGRFEPTLVSDLVSSGCMFALADGMGGSAMGERASEYAIKRLLHDYYRYPEESPPARLAEFINKASQEIYAFAESKHTQMGTTLVAAVVLGDQLIVANVGDSRAYLIRQEGIIQITDDHSIVGELVRSGELSEEEAMASKNKNRLSRCLGREPETRVDIFQEKLRPGDMILLCSDGLTRYARRQDILDRASQGSSDEIAQRLVCFANRSGGADNVSVIVIEVGQPTTEDDFIAAKTQVHALEQVNWDELETSPGIRRAPYRRRRKQLSLRAKRASVLAAIAVLLLLTGYFAMTQAKTMIIDPVTTFLSTIRATDTLVQPVQIELPVQKNTISVSTPITPLPTQTSTVSIPAIVTQTVTVNVEEAEVPDAASEP